MSQLGSLCVGIDVSKAILDIAASSAIEQFSVGNDSDGFEAIIAELRMYAIALVLMKATGGLETAIVCKRKLTAVCSHQTRIGNLDAHLI